MQPEPTSVRPSKPLVYEDVETPQRRAADTTGDVSISAEELRTLSREEIYERLTGRKYQPKGVES